MKAAVGSALAFALERASDGFITCEDLTALGFTRTQASARLSAWHHSRLFAVVDKEDVLVYRLSSKGRELWEQINTGERSVKDDGKSYRNGPDFSHLTNCLKSILPSAQLEREPTWWELCR